MLPAREPPATGRTWPQRLVLITGIVVVLGSLGAASALGYFGVRLSQIDRVDNLKIRAAAAGEPRNYLIVGTDSRAGLPPENKGFRDDGETGCDCTDTIMVVRVDPKKTNAQILSFPRDLWIPIAGTRSKSRINTAHAKGEQVLIDTIEQNFGVPINHYVEVDFVGFEKLVDAVGGIPMWFDNPVRDKRTGLSISNTKCQVLDGDQARKFVRSRYLEYQTADGTWHSDGTADLGRITRQQVFIRRAVSKAVSKGLTNPATLNDLVSAGVDNLRIDHALSVGDLLALGRKFASFDSRDLVGYSVPSTSYRTSGGAAVQVPAMRAAEGMLNIFRGLPPGAVTPAAVSVRVLNGTGVTGQAADVAAALEAIGFDVFATSTYAGGPLENTVVRFGDGGEAGARLVARHITGGAPLVRDSNLAPGRVAVITGADFTTIHDQLAPEGSPDDLRSTTSTTAPSPTAPSVTTTTVPPTTVTTQKPAGYSTGEPPPGVTCG